MNKIIWVILIIILAGFIAYTINYLSEDKEKHMVDTNFSQTPAVKVSYSNFAEVISKNSIVGDLPSNAVLQLKFYNFNLGERVWEKSFVMRKASVTEENIANADIVLSLDSKYLRELTSRNFCDIIQKANANGDLGFESPLSEASLLWKFKSMMKYKDCLGI